MKLFSLVFLTSLVSLASADYSAFINNNQLYVTVLGDCNTASASLHVSPNCRKDRVTRNYVYVCHVDLVIATTRMYCEDKTPTPKVFTFDLTKENIATETRTLSMKYNGSVWRASLKIKINLFNKKQPELRSIKFNAQ